MLRNSNRLSDLADNPRVTILEGDLNNPADVEKAVAGQDMFFNAVIDHDDAGHNRPTAESGLDYTTLRLPWLNDRNEVKYTITHRDDEFVGVSGSRQSIADVVLKIVADPTFGSNDSLGIADPDTRGSNRPVY